MPTVERTDVIFHCSFLQLTTAEVAVKQIKILYFYEGGFELSLNCAVCGSAAHQTGLKALGPWVDCTGEIGKPHSKDYHLIFSTHTLLQDHLLPSFFLAVFHIPGRDSCSPPRKEQKHAKACKSILLIGCMRG